MAAVWTPPTDQQGRTLICLARQQELAYAVLGAVAPSALTAVLVSASGADADEVALWSIGVLIAVSIVAYLGRSRWHLVRTVAVSEQEVEIRRGGRTERMPWAEITAIDVDHWPAKGGDVVVLEGRRRIVLPAPVSARRPWPRLFADPDFNLKLDYLRSHLALET